MSADKYEQEYHLTPIGWVKGTFYHYSTAKGDANIPSDRVLTIVKECEQSCGFSPEEISWREDWRSKSVSDDRVKRLVKKYGEHPK